MDLKHSKDFYIRSLLNKVKLKEIMTKDVITIDINENFSHVVDKFVRYRIRHLPVVEEKNKLVVLLLNGIFTGFNRRGT